MWLLLMLLYTFGTSHAEDKLCASPFSCSNSTIIADKPNDNVWAYGYKSIYGQLSSVSGWSVWMTAAYAGGLASSISSKTYFECSAHKSCANVESLVGTDCTVYCTASASCADSNIVVSNTNYLLACTGDWSCAHSTINTTSKVYGYGAYSLYNSIIDANGLNVLYIFMYGYHSGYNASVICQSDGSITCLIYCYGNACFGMKLICDSISNDCSEFVVFCSDGICQHSPQFVYESELDSYYFNTSNEAYFDTLWLDIMEAGDDLDSSCSISNEYTYDTQQESAFTDIDIINNQNSDVFLCCRSYVSCYTAPVTIENTNNSVNVVCSGRSSCRYSGEMSIITSIDDNTDSNNNNNNIKNNGIHCLGDYSCQQNIMIFEDSSKTAVNRVHCGGSTACEEVVIYNATYVYCTGISSCRNTTVYTTQNIYILGGSYTAQGSVIHSNGIGNMTVVFGSYSSGYEVRVVCNETDYCNIVCLTAKSCDNELTEIYCYGECNVICNEEENIECPKIAKLTPIPTTIPTELPSLMPTIQPTPFPTIPTIIPTSQPNIDTNSIDAYATNGTNITTSTVNATDNSVNGADGNQIAPDNSDTSKQTGSTCNNHSEIIFTFEIASQVCLVLAFLLPLLVTMIGYNMHRGLKGGDRPKYSAIWKVFWYIGDFYSDVIFAMVLFVCSHWLAYACIFFTLMPHVVSNIICLVRMQLWRERDKFITKYVDKYDWFMILITVFAGFYAALEIAQSRLFYSPMFGMQIRKRDYSSQKTLRFMNNVLLENLPQLVIQVIYALDTEVFDFIVFSTMLFSFLSLTIGILQQCSRWSKQSKYKKDIDKIYFLKVELVNDGFRSYHRYCHYLLGTSLAHALCIDAENIEVYYVYTVHRGICAYIEIKEYKSDLMNEIGNETGTQTDDKTNQSKMHDDINTFIQTCNNASTRSNSTNAGDFGTVEPKYSAFKSELYHNLHLTGQSDIKMNIVLFKIKERDEQRNKWNQIEFIKSKSTQHVHARKLQKVSSQISVTGIQSVHSAESSFDKPYGSEYESSVGNSVDSSQNIQHVVMPPAGPVPSLNNNPSNSSNTNVSYFDNSSVNNNNNYNASNYNYAYHNGNNNYNHAQSAQNVQNIHGQPYGGQQSTLNTVSTLSPRHALAQVQRHKSNKYLQNIQNTQYMQNNNYNNNNSVHVHSASNSFNGTVNVPSGSYVGNGGSVGGVNVVAGNGARGRKRNDSDFVNLPNLPPSPDMGTGGALASNEEVEIEMKSIGVQQPAQMMPATANLKRVTSFSNNLPIQGHSINIVAITDSEAETPVGRSDPRKQDSSSSGYDM